MSVKSLKKFIRRLGGGDGVQNCIVKLLIRFRLNNRYILFSSEKAQKNTVNLNYCHDFKNIGDNISPVIVGFVANKYGIDIQQKTNKTYHLFAIGSILTAGAQDCVVWGSGLLNTSILNRLDNRQLDIRSVRGPLTRAILIDRGFVVPANLGDPALLMPMFYNPKVKKKYKVSIITHTNTKIAIPKGDFHVINVKTDDYKAFINEVKASELVISSSLHGIIFSEVYQTKAIMLRPKADMLKYFDYYYSTGRYEFPIADSIEQALRLEAPVIPDFGDLQQSLLESFPKDLWLEQ